MRLPLILPLFLVLITSCNKDKPEPEETPKKIGIIYVYIGEKELTTAGDNNNIAIDQLIQIRFDKPVDSVSAKQNISLQDANDQEIDLSFTFFNQNQLVKIIHQNLDEGSAYTLTISSDLKGAEDETFDKKVFKFNTLTLSLVLESILIDGEEINTAKRIKDIDRDPQLEFNFNIPINKNDLSAYSSFSSGGESVGYTMIQLDEETISMTASQTLKGYGKYKFSISSEIENRIGRPFDGMDLIFYTEVDSTLKFPEITDDELLTKIQQQTFKYFWDFGHPVSGMARERNTSGETVTGGGSGFGLMAIIVAIERGFITRQEGVDRLERIVDFLEQADRFHGAWPHWMNGTTGKVIPFSPKDDGGDLVETAFMMQGLLAFRQYLNPGNTQESGIIDKINTLWETVEWDWYTQGGEDVLYWHWSPNYGWDKNHKITGWNEALIIYVLAASSTTHTIDVSVYTKGWSRNGAMVNTSGNSYYGYTLPLRNDMGGPLFFAHYSFLGLDPRNLSDQFANYWDQNVFHSKINHAYCADNPLNYVAYSSDCWGLTASDGYFGYSAHSPNNDRGVIAPTAATSSIPYAPEESMDAIRFFYYILGDRLWGEYGFYDAFDFTNNWVAGSYIAIDQGPIVVMIENYRTQLIWDLFMSCPEVQAGLTKLGFTY